MDRIKQAALEAEYALQADAFIQGLSDFVPKSEDYGVSPSRSSEILGILLEGEAGVAA